MHRVSSGTLLATQLNAPNLTLTNSQFNISVGNSLVLQVAEALTVDSTSKIDVTGKGVGQRSGLTGTQRRQLRWPGCRLWRHHQRRLRRLRRPRPARLRGSGRLGGGLVRIVADDSVPRRPNPGRRHSATEPGVGGSGGGIYVAVTTLRVSEPSEPAGGTPSTPAPAEVAAVGSRSTRPTFQASIPRTSRHPAVSGLVVSTAGQERSTSRHHSVVRHPDHRRQRAAARTGPLWGCPARTLHHSRRPRHPGKRNAGPARARGDDCGFHWCSQDRKRGSAQCHGPDDH